MRELLIISRCYFFFCNLWSLICWCITIFIHQLLLLCIPYYTAVVFWFFIVCNIILYTIITFKHNANRDLKSSLIGDYILNYIKMRFFVLVIRRNVIAVIVITIWVVFFSYLVRLCRLFYNRRFSTRQRFKEKKTNKRNYFW